MNLNDLTKIYGNLLSLTKDLFNIFYTRLHIFKNSNNMQKPLICNIYDEVKKDFSSSYKDLLSLKT